MIKRYAHADLAAQYAHLGETDADVKFYNDHRYIVEYVTAVNHYYSGHPMTFGKNAKGYMIYWHNVCIVGKMNVRDVEMYCNGWINAHCASLLK